MRKHRPPERVYFSSSYIEQSLSQRKWSPVSYLTWSIINRYGNGQPSTILHKTCTKQFYILLTTALKTFGKMTPEHAHESFNHTMGISIWTKRLAGGNKNYLRANTKPCQYPQAYMSDMIGKMKSWTPFIAQSTDEAALRPPYFFTASLRSRRLKELGHGDVNQLKGKVLIVWR